MEEKTVTLQDGEGSTYKLKRTEYNGETLDIFHVFEPPTVIIPRLQQYDPKPQDVWLLSYQKTGELPVYAF